MWFTEHGAKGKELKVFCGVMRTVLWTTSEQINIMDCDGMDMVSEE